MRPRDGIGGSSYEVKRNSPLILLLFNYALSPRRQLPWQLHFTLRHFCHFRAETTWMGSPLLKYPEAPIGAKCGADLGDSFSHTVSFHEKILNPLNVMIERKYTCFRTSWLMGLGLIWGEGCMLALWNRLSLVGKLTRLKLFSTARLRVSAVSA